MSALVSGLIGIFLVSTSHTTSSTIYVPSTSPSGAMRCNSVLICNCRNRFQSMTEIDNQNAKKKELIGECPYPFRSIVNDRLPMGILKASPTRSSFNSEGKLRRAFIFLSIGSNLNC
ncbi:MAG TPA: hypothetical protein PKX66_08895 [Rectinema sp.]|nr:hypothetical protein [Rectinema sp.]